eukprot:13779404-Alexandrium_andersonii.AAC.1
MRSRPGRSLSRLLQPAFGREAGRRPRRPTPAPCRPGPLAQQVRGQPGTASGAGPGGCRVRRA